MGTDEFNAGCNPAMGYHPIQGGVGYHPIQGGVEILLVASCCRNQDKLRPDGPQLACMQTFPFTFLPQGSGNKVVSQYCGLVLWIF